MDLIECRCPHCRGLFRLPPEQVGTVIRCGRCRETFTPTAEEEVIVPADVPTGPAEAAAVPVAVPVVGSKPVSARPAPPPPVPDEPTSSDRVAPVSRFKEREGWRDDEVPLRRRPRDTATGPALMLAALAAVGLLLLAALVGAGCLVYRQTAVADPCLSGPVGGRYPDPDRRSAATRTFRGDGRSHAELPVPRRGGEWLTSSGARTARG